MAVAVNALVVHFGDNDALEAGEDFIQAVRQRVQMPEVQRGDALAALARAIDGFVDRAVGRSPAYDERLALGSP